MIIKNFKKGIKFSGNTGFRMISREGVSFEFKESFSWNSKDKYGKSAASFSNNRGGYIIFGIKDKPRELIGLQSTNFEDIDEAKITEYLNSIFSPEIEFEKTIYEVRGRKIGILFFQPSKMKPVMAIKNDGDIKEGEIYYRYVARSEKIKFPELRSILNRIQDTERKHWMELFEKISRIGPENTAVMNIAEGKIEGRGGTVIIDHRLIPKLHFIKEGNFQEKGRPVLRLTGEVKPVSFINPRKGLSGGVRITNSPTAPLVKLEEENMLKEFSLDFKTLITQLRARYSDFKSDKKWTKIKKDLMARGFSITRKLNPNNPRSPQQNFYSPKIIKEFDKYYKRNE